MDLGDGNSLFVLFSGHGGEHVAALAKKHFVEILRKKGSYVKKNYEKALEMTFVEIDQMLLKPHGHQSMVEVLAEL
jgi:serine/threonine protein phosphatase PrpC